MFYMFKLYPFLTTQTIQILFEHLSQTIIILLCHKVCYCMSELTDDFKIL